MKTIRRPISILLAILMVVGMFTMVPISAGASAWTFKLNSNFSGSWAMEDIQSSVDYPLELAAGNYEFQIVAYEDGNLRSYRANGATGSVDSYNQVVSEVNNVNCTFEATGGDYVLNYDGGTGVVTITKKNYVAEISETGAKYETVQAAIDATVAGNTVKLLTDTTTAVTVPVGKDIFIDLNGKKIATGNANPAIMNNGYLEIFDLSDNEDGEVSGKYAVGAGSNSLTIIDNGNFNAQECAVCTYSSTSNAEITIYGGTFTTVDNSVLSGNGSNGAGGNTWTIEGGTFNGNITSPGYVAAGIYAPNNDTWNITGGEFNVTNGVGIAQRAGNVIVSNCAVFNVTGDGTKGKVGDSRVVLPAGTALVYDSSANYPGQDDQAQLYVDDGTFNAEYAAAAGTEENTRIAIAGGEFDQPVPANCCDDGFIPEDKGNGTFGVKTGSYVAQIGDTKYETLEAAFAAAQDGQTITVLDDCNGNGIVAPQGKFATDGLTVDFADHTYTVSGTPVGSTGTETIGFQLLKDNKITFKNGTITGDSTTNNDLQRMIQNYSNLTLDNMTVSMVGQYYDQTTVSTCNGETVIKNSTISAPDFNWAGYDDPAEVGAAALAVGTFSSYPSIDVTVEGTSVINGDVNVTDDNNKKAFSLKLDGGELNGNINLDENAKAAIDDTESTANVTKADTFEQAAPEGYRWVDDGEGNQTLAAIPYVAQIGETKYETLVEAFAAVQDGETITLLCSSTGGGIKVLENQFPNGVTVDFAGYTYTVDRTLVGSTGYESQAFHLEKGNTFTFKNGTITSENARMLVQNYSDLTLDGMTLTPNNTTYTGTYYTLSNNCGNTVIKDTTINSNPTNGSIAFDVCRFSSYPSVKVTVTGDSEINGDVEISASNNDAKDGFSLTLESGTMTGDIVLDASAETAMNAAPEKVSVTKAAGFDQEAPEGYMWVNTETEGVQTIAKAVAKINDTTYATLVEAFAAVQDGETITLLCSSTGGGIKVLENEFPNGVTVDFDGYTYTVDRTLVGSTGYESQAFHLEKGNTFIFKDGTITSENARMLVQNYSNLTLDGMTLTPNNTTYTGTYYTLSNNCGNTVIKDTTINSNPTNGSIAFDVCRFSSYPSVNVTVTGDSVINGDVEISASSGQAKDGFSLNLVSGTMTGDIVVDPTAATAMAAAPTKASVNKKNTFTQDPAEGYRWRDNGDGTSTLVKIPNLFVGNGLAVHGDIGVIFYINPEAAGISLNAVNSVSVDFACDRYSGTVTEFTTDAAKGCIKVTYYVPVAYMASDILASNVKINGLPAIGTDTYSVQKYALDTINDQNAPAARKTLMKEMLNYGAKAKAVFETQMAHPEDAVYEEIPNYTKTTVTVDMIEAAIEDEATDMSTVKPEEGAVFYGSSVIYLSETTLRMVFAIPDGSGSKLPQNAYTGHQGKWYHWVDQKDIPAAQLHKQQHFTVGNATFNYSALDYAKAVMNSNMDQANKDLVSAMYLYNRAAVACFG